MSLPHLTVFIALMSSRPTGAQDKFASRLQVRRQLLFKLNARKASEVFKEYKGLLPIDLMHEFC